MTVDHLDFSKSRYTFVPPLEIEPILESEDGFDLWSFESKEIGISVYVEELENLVDEVADQVDFLWECYGKADPHDLAEDACKLRLSLRKRITQSEVPSE